MKRYALLQARFAASSGYVVALITVFMVGLALRLYGLGSESLWWDEVYAITRMSQPGPLEIIRLSSTDNNPPLFYLILHYWMLLAGDTAFSVRLPSAIAGAFAVFVMYRLGTLLFGRGAGLIAALVLALAAYHVRYAQEARPYSLMVFLTLLSFYFFVRLTQRGTSRYATLGYVISTALVMYTHFYAIFFVGAQIVYLLASRENLRRWILPGAALAILYVPWMVLLAVNVLSPTGAWRGGTTWIPVPTLVDVARSLEAYSGSLPLTIVLTSLAAYGLIGMIRAHRSTAYLLLAWLVLPIAVPFLISHLYRPMLVDRYTIAASPAFYLMVAQGLASLKGLAHREMRHAPTLLVVIVAALAAVSITGYYGDVTNQPWREVSGYVDEHGRSGDLVLLYGGSLPFDYYSERADVDKEAFIVSKNVGIRKSVSTMVAQRDRVWLVIFWETGRARKVLPEQLTRLYGAAAYKRTYTITDRYNNEVATVPYQGNGIDLLLFEGPKSSAREPK